jgi:hypothetical protein
MSLHEDFERFSIAHVEQFIEARQEESLHLDFKTVADPRFERDDRKNLAKAISGFANADGGLILWGVGTGRTDAGVEYAAALQPISPLSQFMAKLAQCTGEAANPAVDGVDHRKIPTGDDTGLAITYVPRSDRGPHMAKCGEDRYYRRTGDRFAKMEHFDIEDMFGRRPRPKLSVYYRFAKGSSGGGPEGTHRDLSVYFGVRNDGRGAAKAPYFAILTKPPYTISRYGIDGNGHFGLDPLPTSGDTEWSRFGGGDGRYVYPGTELDVASVDIQAFEHAGRLDTMRVDFEFAADGLPVERASERIDGRSLFTFVWPDDDV